MEFMDLADITPDAVIFWQMGWIKLNLTIVFTWITMGILLAVSLLATRRIRPGKDLSPWQNFLEAVIEIASNQIEDISQQRAGKYLDFIGTLFLFIAVSNLFAVIPGYVPPTGSLATTSALALCVFVAVPVYGIVTEGLVQYLKLYSSPTLFMLPFNIVSEFTRTLALAVRLFGNIMSANKIAAILMAVIPLVFPVFMHLLELLTGFIQAYIFAVLAMVYITSATRVQYELGEG
ncbi:MAG: F0F1 ATP synthase subunit A [Desulfomonilia bacterium]|jgi:F-type H+-transporting ATPase subunit a|uniref:ATP synthase subunit a 1 n=1 Tax=anaerobic digester metagenome TaxID=1263854 RepID=A0A485LZE2_9ZZZZ|nr:F0F1 ATP synthase subunit A [Pseudomonadota bacterium]HPD20585.1 F0F1 ATP synthase subunit A [Deltaproteobacteria bacterium]HPX17315.1 F0F1 ATP synthase subunit A [Deltaproteobacteria bacterium]HRS55493.1 F0F1 ATP synthase subunit A [Desulfomonilia bacterium]HRV35094.1 F0F1 ATP synthase subunit A [Desulfomonilia bacterium]